MDETNENEPMADDKMLLPVHQRQFPQALPRRQGKGKS
jgi:hypothetical protein